MADEHHAQRSHINAPIKRFLGVLPKHDLNDLAEFPRQIKVVTGGTLAVVEIDGSVVAPVEDVTAGDILDWSFRRILTASTAVVRGYA